MTAQLQWTPRIKNTQCKGLKNCPEFLFLMSGDFHFPCSYTEVVLVV